MNPESAVFRKPLKHLKTLRPWEGKGMRWGHPTATSQGELHHKSFANGVAAMAAIGENEKKGRRPSEVGGCLRITSPLKAVFSFPMKKQGLVGVSF